MCRSRLTFAHFQLFRYQDPCYFIHTTLPGRFLFVSVFKMPVYLKLLACLLLLLTTTKFRCVSPCKNDNNEKKKNSKLTIYIYRSTIIYDNRFVTWFQIAYAYVTYTRCAMPMTIYSVFFCVRMSCRRYMVCAAVIASVQFLRVHAKPICQQFCLIAADNTWYTLENLSLPIRWNVNALIWSLTLCVLLFLFHFSLLFRQNEWDSRVIWEIIIKSQMYSYNHTIIVYLQWQCNHVSVYTIRCNFTVINIL